MSMYQSDMLSQYDCPEIWKEGKIIGQGCRGGDSWIREIVNFERR